jgi:hypothetical protein
LIRCSIRSGMIGASRNSSPRSRRSNIWEAESLPQAKALPLACAPWWGAQAEWVECAASALGFSRSPHAFSYRK